MTVFLRCKCPGGSRTKRAPKGCNHKWSGQFKHGGPRPIPFRTPHTNKAAAEDWARAFRTNWIKRAEGKPVDPEFTDVLGVKTAHRGQRLADCRDQALENLKGEVTEDSRAQYARIMEGFVACLGPDFPAHTLTPFDVNRWRRWLLDTGITRETVNGYTPAVRHIVKTAGRSHCVFGKTVTLHGKTVEGILNYRSQKKERKHRKLTDAEVTEAWSQLPDPYDLITRVTYESLGRLSEVYSLKRKHVGTAFDRDGLEYGWVMKQVKGGGDTRTSIPLDLARTLMARAVRPDDYLFPTVYRPEDSNKKNTSRISGDFHRYFKRIGLKMSHHTFRHTGVSLMLDRACNHQAIQEHAGWTSTRQIGTYGHVSEIAARDAVDGNARAAAAILATVTREPIKTRTAPRRQKTAA